jgi:hypothetical protein
MGPREVQDVPADGADDLAADRDQGLLKTWHLRAAAERGAVQPELLFLKYDEGRRRQRDAQLIGPEAGTTGASEGQREFDFLEPILAIATGAIDVAVNPLVCLPQIGDDEAQVRAVRDWRATELRL